MEYPVSEFTRDIEYIVAATESYTNFASILEDEDDVAMEGPLGIEDKSAELKKKSILAAIKEIFAKILKMIKSIFIKEGKTTELTDVVAGFGDPVSYLKDAATNYAKLAKVEDVAAGAAYLDKMDKVVETGTKKLQEDKGAKKKRMRGLEGKLRSLVNAMSNVKFVNPQLQLQAVHKVGAVMAMIRRALTPVYEQITEGVPATV